MPRSSRRAFTLVETIVVLAIVAILAALLLSALARSRHNAERTTCQSNLQQLAVAMQLYLQDSAGGFPPEETSVSVNGVGTPVYWSDRVERTTPVQAIIHCPSAPADLHMFPSEPDYSLGRDVSTDAGQRPHAPFHIRLESQIAAPAMTELFNEINRRDGDSSVTGRPIQTKDCGVQDIFNLHLDGANIAYVDGHVKWMSAPAQAAREEVCGW